MRCLSCGGSPVVAGSPTGGTGLAVTINRAMSRNCHRRRQRGVTLVEMLVVLFLFGMIAMIGTIQVNKTWQRYRLDNTANEVRNFMQSAFVEVGKQRAEMFLRLVPPSGATPARLAVCRSANGSGEVAAYEMPSFISLSTTSVTGFTCNWPCAATGGGCATITTPRVLRCDPLGRATNSDPTQVRAVQTLVLTHRDMVDAGLDPRVRWEMRIYPIWQVLAERGLY